MYSPPYSQYYPPPKGTAYKKWEKNIKIDFKKVWVPEKIKVEKTPQKSMPTTKLTEYSNELK